MLDRSPRRSVSNFRGRVGWGSVNMVVTRRSRTQRIEAKPAAIIPGMNTHFHGRRQHTATPAGTSGRERLLPIRDLKKTSFCNSGSAGASPSL